MRVRALEDINNFKNEKLVKKGKIYEVITKDGYGITIKNEKDNVWNYDIEYFEEVDPVGCEKQEDIKPDYYHKGISPFRYIKSNQLDFFEGNIIKYITRYKDKNGLEDLIKARTYLDFIINEWEELK